MQSEIQTWRLVSGEQCRFTTSRRMHGSDHVQGCTAVIGAVSGCHPCEWCTTGGLQLAGPCHLAWAREGSSP